MLRAFPVSTSGHLPELPVDETTDFSPFVSVNSMEGNEMGSSREEVERWGGKWAGEIGEERKSELWADPYGQSSRAVADHRTGKLTYRYSYDLD